LQQITGLSISYAAQAGGLRRSFNGAKQNLLSYHMNKRLYLSERKFKRSERTVGKSPVAAPFTPETLWRIRPSWHAVALAAGILGAVLALGGCDDGLAKVTHTPAPPYNATGTPDTSFGASGTIAYPSSIGGVGASGTSIAIDSSGRLLIGGNSETTSAGVYEGSVWRLFSNGLPDSAFGSGGVAVRPGGISSEAIYSVLPDGADILATGQTCAPCNELGFWRFNANGTLKDPSLIINSGDAVGSHYGLSALLDVSGNTVVAGGSDVTIGIWRFLPSGAVDAANFNAGGPVPGYRKISISGTDDLAKAVALDASGKIIVAGHTVIAPFIALYLTRLNTDGSTDTTFNAVGAVPGQFTDTGAGRDTEGDAIVMLPNGQFLVAGYTTVNTAPINKNVAIWRFNANGTLDATFGTAGRVDLDGLGGTANLDDIASSIAVDSLGRILVGATTSNPGQRMALVRLSASGTLDATFGTGGVLVDATYVFNNNLGGPAVALTSGGMIYVTGAVAAGPTTAMAVWKFK
jgi:uncharacterized delta-60 repeat protein